MSDFEPQLEFRIKNRTAHCAIELSHCVTMRRRAMASSAPSKSEIKNGRVLVGNIMASCPAILSNSETVSCCDCLIFMIGSTGKVRPAKTNRYTESRSFEKIKIFID